MAPRRPKTSHQHLPPILRKICQASIPGYSKGSRGLSVLPRVGRILTTTAISPSPSLRQRPSRYAIHARRNLPDKELRYLRTVIVTAAVYRGLGRKLLPHLFLPSQRTSDASEQLVRPLDRNRRGITCFLDLPAPGRRQTLYILLRVSRVLCF